MCIDIDLVNKFVLTVIFQMVGKSYQTGFNEFIPCGLNETLKKGVVFDFNNISIRYIFEKPVSRF